MRFIQGGPRETFRLICEALYTQCPIGTSITDPRKLGTLLCAVDDYTGTETVRSALNLLAYTFVRPGELRLAEWTELDTNNERREWHIPPEHTKMKRLHIVPLSGQAIQLFDKMRDISGRGRYIFPSARTKSGSRPLSDNAFVAALRSMGCQ